MKDRLTWRRVFRLASLGLLLAGVGLWLLGGAHVGWTQTSVPIRTLDEVTGLEAVQYKRRFVPGVDFLAIILCVAGLLAGTSFLLRHDVGPKRGNTQEDETT
ncbi:MAG: hypothetical protein RMN51_08965 [Verrucomicrobiota bacterium]|nr:hypothetical protein [Limisphaera sp.]MDW8382221.1 hypothetical protein [Verrucomicrobiota bacterium]